ncbi:MAG: hypothetical protein ACYTHM_13990 [Planctomycetota bacterium]|jgi:hypothetical protein
MAKASRRRPQPAPVEEDMDEPMEDMKVGDTLMTALLIVSFAFIFVGIILGWWTLHQNFDTPFLGMVQKAPNEMVKAQAEKDFRKAQGEKVEGEEEEEYEEDEEEEPAEEDE